MHSKLLHLQSLYPNTIPKPNQLLNIMSLNVFFWPLWFTLKLYSTQQSKIHFRNNLICIFHLPFLIDDTNIFIHFRSHFLHNFLFVFYNWCWILTLILIFRLSQQTVTKFIWWPPKHWNWKVVGQSELMWNGSTRLVIIYNLIF